MLLSKSSSQHPWKKVCLTFKERLTLKRNIFHCKYRLLVRGQTSCAVFGATIQTNCNFKAHLYHCSHLWGCFWCRCLTLHSRLSSNILVQLCGHNVMFDYLIRFLHEDFLQSLLSSHSNARSCSTTTEGTKCTEHRTIQKGRVQCTVGTVSISYLLCPIYCSGNFNSFK